MAEIKASDVHERGVYHISNNASKYQPVRKNNFEFFADFSGIQLVKPGSRATETNAIIDSAAAQEVIKFSVVSFNPPHFSQDPIEIVRGNSKAYYAGVPTFETGDLKINDFIGADGKSILEAWQACSYDIETDTIPSSDKYKVDADVIEFLPDGKEIRRWHLYGCWITKLAEDGWDATSGDKNTITATIRYDRAVPTTTYEE